MQYNSSHTWGNDDYYGASFEAMKRLGELHGYKTIFSFASTNIYMLDKNLMGNPDIELNVSYQPMQYHKHNPNGKWVTL